VFEIKIGNLDKSVIKQQAPAGVLFKPVINAADYGMAFDSMLEDYILTFLNDVTVQVASDYVLYLLISQKDNRGSRNIQIEDTKVDVNNLSDEQLEKKINEIIEKKLNSMNEK